MGKCKKISEARIKNTSLNLIIKGVGAENMFIFGMNVDEVSAESAKMRGGFRDYVDKRLARVFDTIRSGTFSGDV